MSLEIEGKIIKINTPLSGQSSNGTWKKQDFIVETLGQYPKKVCFTAWGDLTDMLNKFKEGDSVKVSFNPESREYNERWYTELKAWKINKVGESTTVISNVQEESTNNVQDDDLPF